MTKVTKTEKILRKATSKWDKFLAEGAFKSGPVNEMTMGERGMVDAQDGNPPSKIGHGNEEYMAAFNAVMKKMGKEPLPIVKPDQAYLDALQRGNLEEMGPATGHVEGTDAAGVIRQIAADLGEVSGVMNNASSTTTASEFAGFIQAKANELLEAANELGIDGPAPALQEQEEQGFQVGEFVYVVNGSLKGASGKILEPVTTTTGEEGFAIELYSAADKRVFGKRGDEVIALAGDLESGGTSDDMELYDIDERSEDDERDLEKPVKYGSGAELEFDPKAQKFYDRKRDIYLDDEEADALIKETVRKTLSSKKKVKAIRESLPPHLAKFFDAEGNLTADAEERVKKHRKERPKAKIKDVTPAGYGPTKENNPSSFATRVTHSSDPEMNQVMDIAADMLEMPPRSRGTITLKSVQSALEAQSFDTKMERGMLIVDDKYVIAKKELLPKTAQKISFTKYAADYLSNLQGEQQNLPMQ